MSNQQPNAWQTAGGPRHSHSASRTPLNRSGTASPNQHARSPPLTQSRPESGRPQQQMNNVWVQRSSSAEGSNGQAKMERAAQEEDYKAANGFNAAEVKAFLSREAVPEAYRPVEAAGTGRGGAGTWGSRPSHMANNQPFFVQLAKQIATLEGGG